jgi:hypothetical protein
MTIIVLVQMDFPNVTSISADDYLLKVVNERATARCPSSDIKSLINGSTIVVFSFRT